MKDKQISQLKKLFELSLTLSGDPLEIFGYAAKMIGELLEVKLVCLSEIQGVELNFLAVYTEGEIYSNAGSCLLAITPCATVEESKDFRIYDQVQALFPQATFLQDHNAYSYCGFPSLDNHGKVVAVTCLLDDKPHDFTDEDQWILRIIGQRIGMEIERKHNLEVKEQVSEALRINEDRLHQAIRISKTGIFDQNYANKSLFCSPELRTHFGWDANLVVTTQTFTASIYRKDRKRVIKAIQRIKNLSGNGDGLLDIEYRILRPDGEIRWLATRSQTLFESNGNVYRAVRTVGAVRDITEKKLAAQEQAISATAFQTQEGIIITDANQTIVRVNQAFTNITGYTAQEVIGNKPSILKSGLHDSAFYYAMHKALQDGGYWQGEIWDRHKDGHSYPKWLTITAVKDSADQVTHYVGNFSDISERKVAEDKIRWLAFYDPLTKLPNRTLLIDRLEHAIAIHSHAKIYGAVLFLDLDNFKILNDIKGHYIGDELLIAVAERLKSCVSEVDSVSRLGGDEFVVLLEEIGESDNDAVLYASSVTEKIIAVLSEPYQLSHTFHYISASIGIVLFNSLEATVTSILSSADTAMYEAKRNGKNTYRFFDPNMQHTLEKRSILETALRKAVANKEFRLFYQPLVNAQKQIISVEALIRWQHPEQGVISPAQFIPLAEETGLILSIGHWVLESACVQLKAWKDQPETRQLSIAVNISAKQFYQTNFVEEVQNLMVQYGIKPLQLKMELTESMVLEDINVAIEKMLTLKSLGIVLSMDDFGTGFSSLSYLKQLPFDQMKIDKSFVDGINNNSNDAFIVETVIALGQKIGMDIVAEGIEDVEQWELLKRMGCGTFQGYYFFKPMAVQELVFN